MPDSLKSQIISGVFWTGLRNIGSYGINFAISLILARLLSPEDFGVVAIVGVFTALFGTFIDSGLSSALVQKKDLKNEDCSSVFFVNFAMALFLYSLLFFTAPLIAQFFKKTELVWCLRVSALTMVIGSLTIVQGTMIYRKMQFHLDFRISLIALVVSGTVGVWMAFTGFGVWALITQTLTRSILGCLLQWYWGKWRPILALDFTRLKGLFQFGWKMFCSSLLDNLYNNLYPLLIGKLFNLTTLSYYNRGNHIPSLGMSIINNTLGCVMFPAFSQIQNDPPKMRFLMKKALKNIMFLVIPCMAVVFVVARPLTVVLFSDKWLPAVPYMRIFCFVYVFWPLHTTNLNLLMGCGRTDIFLTLEIIKKIQVVLTILGTFRWGPLALVWGSAFGSFLAFIVNSWMSKRLVNYSTWQQTLDLLPMVGVALFSTFVAMASSWRLVNDWQQLLIGGTVFSLMYLLICWVFKLLPEDLTNIVISRLPALKPLFA